MPPEPTPSGEVRPTGVAGLARRCAHAMARYQRGRDNDPRPCYELFRRALVERDQAAWDALYQQYHLLVVCWMGGPEQAEALANHAFERLWKAIPPERFDDFPTLGNLLNYLKRCAQGALIDAARRTRRRQRAEEARQCLHELNPEEAQISPASDILDQVAGDQITEHVIRNLHSPRERLVFRATLEWDLKPAAIAKRWPDQFNSAREVSRMKERIYRRLERDSELRAMLGLG